MTILLAAVTVVFTMAGLVAGLLRGSSASVRHMVWTCGFAMALLIAPLRWSLPQRAIPHSLLPVAVVELQPVKATPATVAVPEPDRVPVFEIIWAMGVLLMSARLSIHGLRLRKLIRTASGKPPVMISHNIRGPMAGGFLRPVILLPAASRAWSASRRRAVLTHEAAHLRRRDPAILLLAHAVTALFWFHPLAWIALARLRAESERACDDAALRTGLLPSGYAAHLHDLAGEFNFQLAIPMAATSHLESRVKHILDPKTNRSAAAAAAWSAALLISVAMLVPLTTFNLKAQPAPGTSTISGTVTDPTGAVVPRARITATNADVAYEESATSDPDGKYSFTSMPAGHYSVEVQSPGFTPFKMNDLALVRGASLLADARLAVGRISEVVTVGGQGKRKPAAGVSLAQRQRIRVGGNVQAAALVSQIKPLYPADLQAQGVDGTVSLQAIISKDGIPQSLTLLKSPDPALSAAAMDAVSKWRYRPALLNGEPIEVVTTIQVNFTLEQ